MTHIRPLTTVVLPLALVLATAAWTAADQHARAVAVPGRRKDHLDEVNGRVERHHRHQGAHPAGGAAEVEGKHAAQHGGAELSAEGFALLLRHDVPAHDGFAHETGHAIHAAQRDFLAAHVAFQFTVGQLDTDALVAHAALHTRFRDFQLDVLAVQLAARTTHDFVAVDGAADIVPVRATEASLDEVFHDTGV